MYQPRENTVSRGLRLRHALAGLQASVLGVLVMFAGLGLGSLFHGRSIWVVPNLFSTTFFGSNAYRNRFASTSWAGLALTFAIYGLLGVIWGCAWRDKKVRWLGVYGGLTGLAVYFLFYDLIWRQLNPMVTLYAPDRQLQFGHIIWGMILARSPLYAMRISEAGQPPPQLPRPEPVEQVQSE
jgi:hypothetical protein